MRILAVDDNPFILDFLPAILQKTDFRDVSVAASGPQALDILAEAEAPFDCLLLDIEMPEMDGITLCRRIRSLDAYHDTPILMLTLKSDPVSIEQAFAAGANDYLTKPFEIKEMATRLRVAKRMTETSDKAPRLNPNTMTRNGLPGIHKFGLEDPVYVLGVNQLVLPFSLGNYLSQLSRSNLKICQAFAVKIDDIDALYRNGTSREFVSAIAAAAQAIAEVVDRTQLLMAYAGDGTILGIVTEEHPPVWHELEDRLQSALDNMDLRDDDGRQMKVTLSVGRPVHPSANKTQRVKFTFDRVVRLAEARQATKFKANENEVRSL
ncbi:PleD family two-component system response regulator [Sulfitobacter sp. 20_GPM-1509m]|uniref:response regulator n=1 Tax=Sulfitobacter sp. 20_GPM-1509m TaxID=1380367 RepID=UPI000688F9A7|nr:response regulator [Sulfitobacter sp. 20_GPM-1509m]